MTKLLILIVVVLGILAVAQLARVYELTSKLRGKREEDISDADNRMNATLMWLFPIAYFGFFIWLVVAYGDKMLPVAASTQGADTDALLDFNWWILIPVFFLTNLLLFYYAGKYTYSKDRRAFWQPHNNKLELLWTVVPALVLFVIIIYGLNTWQQITGPASPEAVQVELYAKQFDWTARYPGKDGVLGATDYRLINGDNPLGIVTANAIEKRMAEIAQEKAEAKTALEGLLPDSKVEELEHRIAYLDRMAARIVNLRMVMQQDIKANGAASTYLHGADDVVTKDFYLPVRKEALILIRSRDIIHSAFIPHLRIQMNAVPGMTTSMKVVPTITTDSMRTVPEVMRQVAEINAQRQAEGKGEYTFDFLLLCNKICGASHYNMQMPLIVTTPDEFDAWVAEANKKPFEGAEPAAEPAPVDSSMTAPKDSMAVAALPSGQ
ncbi:MAG: cytochrome c oxidase subunit II [Flavobacteriales bacterium]|nr:cytochrome c oxidase subunit II [Flavobacteriales bacterium]